MLRPQAGSRAAPGGGRGQGARLGSQRGQAPGGHLAGARRGRAPGLLAPRALGLAGAGQRGLGLQGLDPVARRRERALHRRHARRRGAQLGAQVARRGLQIAALLGSCARSRALGCQLGVQTRGAAGGGRA